MGFHNNSRVMSEVVEEMIKLFRVNETAVLQRLIFITLKDRIHYKDPGTY